MNKKQIFEISKFLSLVLRHKPETIGISLDPNGWIDVNVLIEKSNSFGVHFDKEILEFVVATNPKKRFSFNDSLDKIRANQGHSIEVDLGFTNQIPPRFLYHGTAEKFVASIFENGIEKQSRQHVHLSNEVETAFKVGQRHGKPVILEVNTEAMFNDSFVFYISDNGVWLTDNVPVKYIKLT